MATQEEITDVRRRVGDKSKDAEQAFEFGGSREFRLTYNNVIDCHVMKNGANLAFTIDNAAGLVTVSDAETLENGDVITITYTFAAYSDAEITSLIDSKGVVGATIEILRDLLADTAKMFDYSEGATEAKQSQVFSQVKSLLGIYKDELAKQESDNDKNNSGNYGIAFGNRSHPLMDGNRRYTEPDLSRQDF